MNFSAARWYRLLLVIFKMIIYEEIFPYTYVVSNESLLLMIKCNYMHMSTNNTHTHHFRTLAATQFIIAPRLVMENIQILRHKCFGQDAQYV